MRSVIGSLRAEARRQGAGLGDLVAPNLCEVCGGRSPRPAPLCEGCAQMLREAAGPADRLALAAAFRYEGEVARRTVARFKYSGVRRLAGFLGEAMARAWRREGFPRERVLLVPVPLAPDRERLRGYNQALLLANELSNHLEAPVLSILRRVRATPSQTFLGTAGRSTNLERAFAVGRATPYLPIVLVDDVRTTGATLQGCRRVLADAGHSVIGAVTAFWTPPDAHRARCAHEREEHVP